MKQTVSNTAIKRYDELKVNDVIWWYGARVKIVAVRSYPYTEEHFKGQTDKVIRFDIEPYDDDAVMILGNFYAHGTYGGVGCLEAEIAL